MEVFSRTIGRGTSRFFGFDEARIDHLYAESDAVAPDVQPKVEVLHDCVYVPQRHALYTREGRRIDATGPAFLEPSIRPIASQQAKLGRENAEKCPDQIAIPSKLERCDSRMLLLGTIIPHFGHFLTDSMSRLWRLDDEPDDAPLLCVGVIRAHTKPYERTIADALGLPDRLVAPGDATLFREVICAYPSIQLARRIYSNADRAHRRVGADLARRPERRRFQRPVYLSRSRLGPNVRGIKREHKLEVALLRLGFEVVHPQSLSFADQVALFESGVPVVGAIGSAFHTLLFRTSETPARIALLCDSYVHQRFLLQDAVKPVEASYLNCMVHDSEEDASLRLHEQTFRLDVPRALEMLDAAGFLRRSNAS